MGNGSNNGVLIGNGTGTVTVGSGSYNQVTLGTGTDVVTIQGGGSHDTINGGPVTRRSTSALAPTTPTTAWPTRPTSVTFPPGKTAASLHDTITNCTVVTP